jgi:threonine aldolase
MDRRHFLAAGGLAAASPLFAQAIGSADAAAAAFASASTADGLFQRVNFTSDGVNLSPLEYATLLHDEVSAPGFEADFYSLGGHIAELERTFAGLLGKEAAIFVPTGTLANHIAVRTLAGSDRRVLVQAESHLYNDSGDAASSLSGLNLIPLAPGHSTLELAEVQRWLARSASGRVETNVGVISIENPVRRRGHQMVDFDELQRVCEHAREQGIRLHLDGARMFNLPYHSGHSVREYAALFDTVYVSLWKHFNAGAGAILAGDAHVIEGLFHTRRMFGGALPYAWPQAALATRYATSYEADYAQAWQAADQLIERLHADGRFHLHKPPEGTSRLVLKVDGVETRALAQRVSERGIDLPKAIAGTQEFPLMVNTSILRRSPEDLARVFVDALGDDRRAASGR